MGIIKAAAGAVQGAAADQWKECYAAGEMGSELLMMRAKRMTGGHGENKGNSGVITDGSRILVGEGECAVVTEGGKVIGIYDQPGEQIFRSEQSRGIFGGGAGAFFRDVGQRISFGGEAAISQRIYYINTKELTGGTIRAEGIPLRFRDPKTGLDVDGGVSCSGSYTFRICDPELFYKSAIRSSSGRYRRDLLKQMDSEVLTALSPALAEMTKQGIRPHALAQHTETLCQTLRSVMSDKWSGLRGIEVFSLALESVNVLDGAMFRALQRDSVLKDPVMAGAHITGATADAIGAAAKNSGGRSAFLYGTAGGAAFIGGWRCSCGAQNSGKFCTECGTKKPAEEQKRRCTHCGWSPECGQPSPKFCPECGKPFG